MIQNLSSVGIIPARGGSKGLLGKNLRTLAGRPLIHWTIEAAISSKYLDRVIVTTEDVEIANSSKQAGADVPFIRPATLAADESSAMDVIVHALSVLDKTYDLLVLLQPTSPLRGAQDIDACMEMYIRTEALACVSVARVKHPIEWCYGMHQASGVLQPVHAQNATSPVRRQDGTSIFSLNGAIYVMGTEQFLARRNFLTENTVGFEMPQERSIDIDTHTDLLFSEFLLSQKNAKSY